MINQGSGPAGLVPSPARLVRVLHGAICLGLVIIGGVFGALVRLRQAPMLGQVRSLGPVTTGVGVVLLVLALAVLRPRIPVRPAEQSPDEFWREANTKGIAMLLWVALEGSGAVGAVGYLLTGGMAPAVIAGVAIVALLSVRPSQLEGQA